MPLLAPLFSPLDVEFPEPLSTQRPITIAAALKPFEEDGGKDTVVEESKIPSVQLDMDSITDTVAASMACSLLGHVLFLKNQVPLPVPQLARIVITDKANARTTKLRSELLDSFDTLLSHLGTTFTALSTAFARSLPQEERSKTMHTNRAYMAILMGPSIGSAKSKVMLAVDGLEAKVWGQRDDIRLADESGNSESDDDRSDDEGGDDEGPSDSDDSDVDDEDETESDNDGDDDDGTSSPPLPSAFAEEQRILRTADRLLSRALVSADCDGNGLASEISPTQTHILIRAPRRFVHPAWIPRQNVTASMDNFLEQFLGAAGHGPKTHKKKAKIEGLWVACQKPSTDLGKDAKNEEDEMIWWSWDGKLVGFAGW
ncbi:uncharacterized protein BT62DRAFT_936919 [Guyanagaster necrorhizus]|uniref:Uncharacterized protein n=1 Tax=Guyanagaster necrorhizus TaxID=856835 RepID=A0A9P8ANC7_9AGAR|nr:uncharacterized protein BT62DRAFT_936919 [Guyanagaster necrorhizus MCA 3950]KAG7441606.1 hypothetical protein BT62DRAFT_936919 [Guyanagaster necrorhizus MCA 3950]